MRGSETRRNRMKQRKSAESIAVEAGNTFFIPDNQLGKCVSR